MPFRLSNDALGRTVGECIAGNWGLSVNCLACHHHVRFPQATLATYPAELPISEIAARLVCSACGATEGVVHLNNANWQPGMG